MHFQEAFQEFQRLEERITHVSTKVVHLGDQLESSNNRRTRAMEAQNLMQHLTEFEKPKPALDVFTDPGKVRREGGRTGEGRGKLGMGLRKWQGGESIVFFFSFSESGSC